MTTSYKFYYFAARGYGELSRMIFAYAGVPFEDIRYTRETWAEAKPTCKSPSGKLPMLVKAEGQKESIICGSLVIARWLAEEFGLGGKDGWENAEISSLVDMISDLRTDVGRVRWEADETRKATMKKKLVEETLPNTFGKLSDCAWTGAGHLWGGRLTWADIMLYTVVENMQGFMAGDVNPVLDGCPKLKEVCDKVKTQPKIAEWIKKRPDTEF